MLLDFIWCNSVRIWNFRLDSHCSWRCERNNIFSEAGNKQTFYRIRTETFPNNWLRVIHFDRHCYSVSVCAFRYLSKFPEYLLSFLFSIEICIIRFVYFSHRASFQIKFYLKWNARGCFHFSKICGKKSTDVNDIYYDKRRSFASFGTRLW